MEKRSYGWFWSLMAGALVGGVLATWLAPQVIAWYFDPPAQYGVSCKAPIEWALAKMRVAQLWGIGAGSLLGAVLFLLAFRKRGPSAPPPDLSVKA